MIFNSLFNFLKHRHYIFNRLGFRFSVNLDTYRSKSGRDTRCPEFHGWRSQRRRLLQFRVNLLKYYSLRLLNYSLFLHYLLRFSHLCLFQMPCSYIIYLLLLSQSSPILLFLNVLLWIFLLT